MTDTQEHIVITIEPQDIFGALEKAIQSATADLFAKSSGHGYSGKKTGAGYKVLEEKVLEWVEKTDFSPQIRAVAAGIVDTKIRKAVDSAMDKYVGEIIARMISTGSLDAMIAGIVANKIEEASK